MIRETGRCQYKETIIEVECTVAAPKDGFDTDEKAMEQLFENELKGFEMGWQPAVTCECSVRQVGFTMYHNDVKAFTRTYEIKVKEPVLK